MIFKIAGSTLKTTEFVQLNQSTALPGPDLPFPFKRHCMAKINENLVVIIGGEYSETNVLIVDINNNFSMSYGPKIINERYMHTCGTFKNNGKTNVIVAGGYNGTNMVNMTEIWDPTTEFGWIGGIHFTIWLIKK